MTAPVDANSRPGLRRHIYDIIEHGRGEDWRSRTFDTFIVLLILANIGAFCAETVPELYADWGVWFDRFETFSVLIFTIEYGLRIWTAVEMPFLARMSSMRARWSLARRPLQIIDLFAILPFYVGQALGLDFRLLRVFRLFRFFKLSRYSPALHTLMRVLQAEGRSLTGAGLLLLGVLLFSSAGMYLIEGAAQPDKFGSVPLAAYWAMTTLTTVGYGDVVPITPLGKLWAMITMLCGLCVLALPVAIISSGFAQEVGRRDFVITWSLMSRIPILANLAPAQVAEILPLLHAQNLPPNIEVIGSGESGTAMYFVASGEVRLSAPGGDVDYRTGAFFGIVALVGDTESIGRYVTTTRCRLLKLYRDDFLRIERANPELGTIIRTAAEERHTARRRLIEQAASKGA